MRKLLIAFTLLFAVLLISTMYVPRRKPQGNGYNTNVIHFNVVHSYVHMLTHIIKEKDFLSPYLPDGVTVEWTTINTSPELRDAMVSGNVDITILASPAVITAIENGLPILILSGHVVNSCGIFSKNSNIKGIEDLALANGIYISSLSATASLAILAMCQDEFNDAQLLSEKFIAQSNDLSMIAFESSNDVDCFANGFPNTVRTRQIDGVHQVVDLTPYARKYDLGNYYVVSEKFYNENPLLIEGFRKAQKDALDFAASQPEEAAELLEKVFEIERNITAENMKSIIAEEMKKSPPRLEISGYDKCAGLLYEAGILSKPPVQFADLPNYKGAEK